MKSTLHLGAAAAKGKTADVRGPSAEPAAAPARAYTEISLGTAEGLQVVRQRRPRLEWKKVRVPVTVPRAG